MADRKDCNAVISRFDKYCKDRKVAITINRYVERWAADDLLESMSMSEIMEAMKYYFEITQAPSWRTFARAADKLLKASRERDIDIKVRAERREKLREVLNES